MRKVRFLTVEKVDEWMRSNTSIIPTEIVDAWLDVKLGVERLYSAAMWGLDAHPSHCYHDVSVAQDALRPYDEFEERD
jgi:hypothetical protein